MSFTSMPRAAALITAAIDSNGEHLSTDVLHHMLALLLSSDQPNAEAAWRASFPRIAAERGARRATAAKGPDIEAISLTDRKCEGLGLIERWGREKRTDTYARRVLMDGLAPPDDEFDESAEGVGQYALDLVSAGATPAQLAICARIRCMGRGENSTPALSLAELVEDTGLSRKTLRRVLEGFRDAPELDRRRLGVRAQLLAGIAPDPNRWTLFFDDPDVDLRARPAAPKPVKVIGLAESFGVEVKAGSTWNQFDEDEEHTED